MLINLFDNNFPNYANPTRPVLDLQYIKPPLRKWDGVTVFTDEFCFTDIPLKIDSKYKIAWALESPAIKPALYEKWETLVDIFDKIYLCDPRIIHPKVGVLEFGGCWIPIQDCSVYSKTKNLSIVASNKTWTVGHKLRHEIVRNITTDIDLWGTGYNKFDNRLDPFKDYRYSIVVENCIYPGYYTEKIIDCFATGCIPIYYGDPYIGDKFNKKGFYTFNNIPELVNIIKQISIEDYYSKLEYIKYNFAQVERFSSPDKNLLDNIKNDKLND